MARRKGEEAEVEEETVEKRPALQVGQHVSYSRKTTPPMPLEYMNQMAAMMIHANLMNGAPGRDAKLTAKLACDHADILQAEWVSRHPKAVK